MRIYGIRCREVMACAGSWVLIAEAAVEIEGGREVYVTAQEYEGYALTVSDRSVYNFIVGNVGEPVEEFSEEYSTWKASQESRYAEVFKKLKSALKMLGRVE